MAFYSLPKSEVSTAEIRARKGIFLEMIYADINSKHFIKIQQYTVLAQAGERRRLPSFFCLGNKFWNFDFK